MQPQRGRRSLALHLVRHGNVSAATNAPGSWDAPMEEMRDSNEPKLNSLNIMDALKTLNSIHDSHNQEWIDIHWYAFWGHQWGHLCGRCDQCFHLVNCLRWCDLTAYSSSCGPWLPITSEVVQFFLFGNDNWNFEIAGNAVFENFPKADSSFIIQTASPSGCPQITPGFQTGHCSGSASW